MRSNKRIEKSLEKLDDDIIWNRNRQKHIRKRLMTEMKSEHHQPASQVKRRLIPIFSMVFLLTIVTTIFLSEFTKNESANEGTANGNAQVIVDENEDDEGEMKEQDNNEDQVTDQDSPAYDPVENEDNQTEHVEDEEQNTPIEDALEDRLLTQPEIMEAIKGQMNTSLSLELPKNIPLDDGMRLTAVTDSDEHYYEVVFYQNKEPIPINNQLLFSDENPAEVVARVRVQNYATQEAADEEIAYEDFSQQGTREVTLGPNLTGYQDAGAGSIWTGWNIGRWALAIQTSTDNREKGVSLAKEITHYLEENMLPAPKQHGFAHLDVENNDYQVTWEKETTVYTIDQVKDPIIALEIAVHFE